MPDPVLTRRTAIAAGAAAFALPRAALAAEAAPVVNRILLENGRLWVGAAIGGETLLFVIDTGTPMSVIRPEIAKRLKMPVVGRRGIGGLGKDVVMGEMVVAPELVFGKGIKLGQVGFTTYEFGRGIPPDAAGLLSAGLFTGYDSEFDFDALTWTVWRDGRPDHDGLTRIASRIVPAPRSGAAPKIGVDATIDGAAYRLMVDTGAPRGVLLFPRATRRSGLFDDRRPFAPEVVAGFGGLASKPGRIVRVERFDMAPVTLERPLITISDPGQRDEWDHDGLIGLDIITTMRLVTDRRANCLWGARTARPVRAIPYRLSGLWLDHAKSGGATVGVVGTGSPAAAAGVRAGDTVTDPPRFEEALRRMSGPPGRAVTLGINGAARSWTLAAWL